MHLICSVQLIIIIVIVVVVTTDAVAAATVRPVTVPPVNEINGTSGCETLTTKIK
jgi:hypothetical protein